MTLLISDKMSTLKFRTKPDLSITSDKHKDALINDKDFTAWQFNVVDSLKGKTVEEIRQVLKSAQHPFAVCMERWRGDFNFGTLIRNSNAFNTTEVFYLGDKKWDRRSAVGVHNYTDVTWLSTMDDFMKLAERYTIIGVDNIPNRSVPMTNFAWPDNTLMVFGEEGVGLTPAMQSFCKDIVEIPMYGSVRSLNCGVASGIVMHDYVRKFYAKQS